MRSKAILLKPTKEQARKLYQWAGSYRFAYNWFVRWSEKTYNETGKRGRYCTEARHIFQASIDWFKSAPAHVFYGAMRDADKDYGQTLKKRKAGIACKLPTCRKRNQRSFYIYGQSVSKKGIYTRLLGNLKSAEPLPDKPADCRVIFEAGKFWLRIPYEKQTISTENQGRVCAIDPGIRTFATVFSPDQVLKVGSGAFSRIQRLAFYLDDLISRTAKEKNKSVKKRMALAISRARLRIRNLIDDLHNQTAGFLFRHFDTVIFPSGNFQSAVKKAGRKIRAKSVRSLLTFSFAKFRNRLGFVAELKGKTLVQVCESYTSKTHNLTGEIKPKLGGAKFTESHGVRIDRDVNGALGIFLKALLVQPLPVNGSAC